MTRAEKLADIERQERFEVACRKAGADKERSRIREATKAARVDLVWLKRNAVPAQTVDDVAFWRTFERVIKQINAATRSHARG